ISRAPLRPKFSKPHAHSVRLLSGSGWLSRWSEALRRRSKWRRRHFFGIAVMLDRRKSSLLPKLPPHRPSAATKAAYQDKVAAFCATILEVQSRLDFAVSSVVGLTFWKAIASLTRTKSTTHRA